MEVTTGSVLARATFYSLGKPNTPTAMKRREADQINSKLGQFSKCAYDRKGD